MSDFLIASFRVKKVGGTFRGKGMARARGRGKWGLALSFCSMLISWLLMWNSWACVGVFDPRNLIIRGGVRGMEGGQRGTTGRRGGGQRSGEES